MASLDDIYDSLDILDKSNTEYLLITIQKGNNQGKADVFYNLKNDGSLKVLAKGLKVFNQEIEKKKDEGGFE
jgi:hypothetical protein